MAELTLEQRVAALEREVAELKGCSRAGGTKLWEQIGRPMTPALRDAFERMVAYGEYFRRTGRDAPSDWNPGDPIPEEHENQS